MTRLRHVRPQMPSWTRKRAGRGFSYRDQHGDALPPEEGRADQIAGNPAVELTQPTGGS
ncbi:MAG: hypothetical protein V9G04_17665 [Nocardioides sp.]|jgi:hypothetical protein